jgi:hypothetical protein
MTDETILQFLIQMTAHVAKLHAERKTTNAGPRYNDGIQTVNIEDEGFSRWMGWRGQEAQGEETAWPADELRQERADRHQRAFKRLREENAELRQFLISIRAEIDRKLGN